MLVVFRHYFLCLLTITTQNQHKLVINNEPTVPTTTMDMIALHSQLSSSLTSSSSAVVERLFAVLHKLV